MRLIERGRLGNPKAAMDSLTELTRLLTKVSLELPQAKAPAAVKSAVDLTLKLLETNAIGPDSLAVTLRNLALASAKLLPDTQVPKAKYKR
jgi:hypothetical protein